MMGISPTLITRHEQHTEELVEPNIYTALIVEESADGQFTRRIGQKQIADLPPGDLLIHVHYSSLNYKDALSATGNRGVTRTYPHTPGIDAAGIVVSSQNNAFQPGDEVIVIGYDLGMNTPGGYGQYIRVPADWAVRRPDGLSLRESMIIGTAGFTAAQMVLALEKQGVTPAIGEILVTGATGGVGSLAVAILATAGYRVVAATGKSAEIQFLRDLGATEVLTRSDVDDASGRPLLKSRWAGVVDTVGGNILATALKSTQYGGVVTCCGLVASPKLETTVFPFILRGVSLIGIDSAGITIAEREQVWQRLATDRKPTTLDRIAHEISLDGLDAEIDAILQGQQRGRVVVKL